MRYLCSALNTFLKLGKNILSFIFPVSLLVSCGVNHGSFTRDKPDWNIIEQQNIFRIEKGIRSISKDWYFYGNEFNAQKWKINFNKPGGKTVQFDSEGEIQYEEDYYYSGNSYTTIDGDFLENLIIHYAYKKDNFDIRYMGDDPDIISILNEINYKKGMMFEVADKILDKWKISRL
jgi:hypothetical protein